MADTSAIHARKTAQKAAVLEALRKSPNFVSAQKLHTLLEQQGEHIGLATVYRQLNALTEDGKTDSIHLNGQQVYRLCAEDSADQHHHHHHMVCENCGKTIEIEPNEFSWIQKVAQDNNFKISSHVLEVFGLCADCQKA